MTELACVQKVVQKSLANKMSLENKQRYETQVHLHAPGCRL